MTNLSDFQQALLESVSAWADRYPCLRWVYIFGSVARGDYCLATSDIDLALEFVADIASDEMSDDYTRLQSETDFWAEQMGQEFEMPVRFSRMHIGEREDAAWPAILAATERPVAVMGKVLMVATPRIMP